MIVFRNDVIHIQYIFCVITFTAESMTQRGVRLVSDGHWQLTRCLASHNPGKCDVGAADPLSIPITAQSPKSHEKIPGPKPYPLIGTMYKYFTKGEPA